MIRPVYLRKIESLRDSVVFYKSRSVEATYQNDVFRSNYLNWKQYVSFFQKIRYCLFDPAIVLPRPSDCVYEERIVNTTAPAWLPNTFNNNFYTTDSLDKYLFNIGWAKLDRIKVFSKISGENHAEIEYVFKYNNSYKNYTYQAVGNKIQRTGSFNERIRLDTIAQIAGGKSLIYKLDYYKSDTMSLPRYLDKDWLIDHWGYFNKKKSGYTVALNRNNPTRYFKQRNSTKSTEVARLGTLQSITFPTGGKTIFEYEQHTCSKVYDYGAVGETVLSEGGGTFGPIVILPQSLQRKGYYRRQQDSLIRFTPLTKNFNTLVSNGGTPLNFKAVNLSQGILENGTYVRGFYVDSTKVDTVGGLRIKSIKTLDSDGKFISNKKFWYSENYKKSNSLISSGILDKRFGYALQSSFGKTVAWFGRQYRLDNQDFNQSSPSELGSTYNFTAIGHFAMPPVTYNEVTEEGFDGSYTTFSFTNYYSKVGGEHLDEPIAFGHNSDNTKAINSFSHYEPYNDKSFERGRICLSESYRNDGKIVGRQKVGFKQLGTEYMKSLNLTVRYVYSQTIAETNGFNTFVNLIVNLGIGILTGGTSIAVQIGASLANPVPYLLPSSSPNSYAYFEEYGYPQKIYTYNYEMSSDSTWTFDYTDPTKKFVTVNNYKYNTFGQLRELKRVQSDGLELLTNNKYIKDYDFDDLYSTFGPPAYCATNRTSCDATCDVEPDPQVKDYCYRACVTDEEACKLNAFTTSITSNPASNSILKMQMKNMVSYPVESIVKRKNINSSTYKVLGGTLNLYGEFNANGSVLYAPQSILKMKQTQTNATADTSKLDASGAFVYDQTRYTVKTFETTPSDGYGAFGNLTKYIGRDGVSNTMTHNAMNYPISKNIGITYGGNEFYSTMEYAPILGMIKTADQNNRKIRNRYDEFNRLRSVSKTLSESGTDNDYLLKLYNYHYFNDNSDIIISDFVVGGCNGDSPASCTLRATIAPNSFVEMKVGSGLTTTITGSFDAGTNTVADAAKYTWINPAGVVSTTAAYTIPALSAANLPSVLGVYYYKVEKEGCQACLKFTISKKTTATDPDLLAEEDK